VEQFNAAGYPAAHLDGTTDRAVRDRTLADFSAGRLRVISNVDLFGEGFDVPAIEAVILLRPTQSTGLFLQMVGRGLRTAEGKDKAIILDHAGNALRHGMPDQIREWSLDAKPKSKREREDDVPKIKQCGECFYTGEPFSVCPNCGHQEQVKSRQIEERSGELIELSEEMLRRAKRKEQSKAKSLDDLIALATERGYKNPRSWAQHVYNGRQKKFG
jgi:superfamily II DNA or RNA helicase